MASVRGLLSDMAQFLGGAWILAVIFMFFMFFFDVAFAIMSQ